MIHIFKSGDKQDLNNYRSILVLPTIARIFEKLLYDQLYKYFTDNEILGKTQWGFRSLHSTALTFTNCTSDWLVNIDRVNVNTVVFLDIKKAFDTFHNYNTRSTAVRNYYVHNANLMKTRKAFTYAGSVAWNELPNAIKEAQSLNVFKAKLKAYLLENDEAHIYL